MRRRMYQNKIVKIIGKEIISSSQSYTMHKGIKYIDIFIVGAGGGGGSWTDWGYSAGGAGAGGECITIKKIPYTDTAMQITIGYGGGGNYAFTSADGGKGGDTVVTLFGNTWTARGGNPGLKSVNESTTPNWGIVTGGQGYDIRSDAIGYVPKENIIMDVYNAHQELIVSNLDGNVYKYNNHYLINGGVPEFHEEGNPTHAAGGSNFSSAQIITSYTEHKGGDFSNTSESIFISGGGGYGGGGAGGYYRTGYSGSGGNGCVVIRSWA